MDVEITLLSDNAVNKKGLLAEHGLSILLERDEQQLCLLYTSDAADE